MLGRKFEIDSGVLPQCSCSIVSRGCDCDSHVYFVAVAVTAILVDGVVRLSRRSERILARNFLRSVPFRRPKVRVQGVKGLDSKDVGGLNRKLVWGSFGVDAGSMKPALCVACVSTLLPSRDCWLSQAAEAKTLAAECRGEPYTYQLIEFLRESLQAMNTLVRLGARGVCFTLKLLCPPSPYYRCSCLPLTK